MAKRYGKTIQLWPGGQGVTIDGDGDSLRVKINGRWRKPNAELARKIKIELTAEIYAERDVWHCDSSLVDDLLEEGSILGGEFSMENVINLYPDPSDWDLEQCREWLDDHGIGDRPDPDPWAMDDAAMIEAMDEDPDEPPEEMAGKSPDELRPILIEQIEADCHAMDEWRDLVFKHADAAEIYEWWRVDSGLAERLKEIGECVLDNAYGNWWGRCCTGQGYLMDGTLQQVAALVLSR